MLARKFALASQSAAHVVGTNVSQSLGKVNYESFLAWVDGARCALHHRCVCAVGKRMT